MALVLSERREGGLFVPHTSEGPFDERYGLDIHKVTRENQVSLLNRAWDWHRELHLGSDRTLQELISHFRPGKEVVFVTQIVPKKIDVGYVIQGMKGVNIGGEEQNILMIGAKVISDDHQGHGLGTWVAIDAIQRHQPDAVTGRTPNPYAILSYYRTGYTREIYPIDRLFPPQVRTEMAVLLDRCGASLSEIELRTGLCRGVYPPGENRLFVLDRENKDAVRIYNAMIDPPVSANLHAGDGVRYWARVDEKKIIHRRPTVDVIASSPVVRIPVVASGR